MRAEPGLFQTGLCYNQTDPTADLPAPLRLRLMGAMPQDPFVREKFTRERTAAKKLAAEYFERFPRGLPNRRRDDSSRINPQRRHSG